MLNHLDIPAIEWLEERVRLFQVQFHAHDHFLDFGDRIVELDRGVLASARLSTYLERRDQELIAEADQLPRLTGNWPKRRSGFDGDQSSDQRQGRVGLSNSSDEAGCRREREHAADLTLMDASKSGRLVIEATDVV